jgi:hypothetical protein
MTCNFGVVEAEPALVIYEGRCDLERFVVKSASFVVVLVS